MLHLNAEISWILTTDGAKQSLLSEKSLDALMHLLINKLIQIDDCLYDCRPNLGQWRPRRLQVFSQLNSLRRLTRVAPAAMGQILRKERDSKSWEWEILSLEDPNNCFCFTAINLRRVSLYLCSLMCVCYISK